jgi:DNA-binding MarR family transcriptional regulator
VHDQPLESSQAARLAGELRVVFGKLKRRLREQGYMGDLTWSQTSVLSRLERDGPTTVTVLAKAEGMRPQSMGAIVSALEVAGFVSGTPNPSDGRQTILSITDSCRAWIDAARTAREDWLCKAIEASLSPAEQADLASAVRLLDRLVNAPSHEGETDVRNNP